MHQWTCFAAIAGAAYVLAGSPIRGELQANPASARLAEQPSLSTRTSLGSLALVVVKFRSSSGFEFSGGESLAFGVVVERGADVVQCSMQAREIGDGVAGGGEGWAE